MIVDSVPLWLAATNAWVIAPERGGPAIVVDAPPDPHGVAALLRRHELTPVALLVTHAHIDHVGGVGGVSRAYSISAYLHPDDEWLAADAFTQLGALIGSSPAGEFAPPDRFEPLAAGRSLAFAGLGVRVLHTPGHSPGHCCFHLEGEGVVFSGDHLFAGSIGRTDLPGGDRDTLMRSMAEFVTAIPAETVVLPGHGPTTTLARELATNPFLEEFRP